MSTKQETKEEIQDRKLEEHFRQVDEAAIKASRHNQTIEEWGEDSEVLAQLVEAIMKNRRLASAIVDVYCDERSYYLVDRTFADESAAREWPGVAESAATMKKIHAHRMALKKNRASRKVGVFAKQSFEGEQK